MTTAAPRAVVDHDKCVGFGLCVELLPAVFVFDQEGKSVAIGAGDPVAIQQAIDDCPRDAIRFERQPSRPVRS